MDFLKKIITDLELHSVNGIRTCFKNGINPNQTYNGKTLFEELISGYLRSTNFKECVKAFLDFGLHFESTSLLAVLLDDSATLDKLIKENSDIVLDRYTLKNAFTPLEDVTLLHICAEFNHVSCAKILISHHADVNAKAGTDEFGFGGQTPIFHTVNQHNNFSFDTMKLLISSSADLKITLKGLIWGKGYEWETYIPAVNPICYALMGLLPQFQRKESDVYQAVETLMNDAYQIDYKPANIPNKYL
ncbi:MAG: ankyrin repeat domain-containing protein [Saprospiraceae bacterium]|nr:ankyrin repeat domain-containing protein [Saprospiraceae bacterium]